MQSFFVTYRITVEAANHLEAARLAQIAVLDPAYNRLWEVVAEDDIDEDDRQEIALAVDGSLLTKGELQT